MTVSFLSHVLVVLRDNLIHTMATALRPKGQKLLLCVFVLGNKAVNKCRYLSIYLSDIIVYQVFSLAQQLCHTSFDFDKILKIAFLYNIHIYPCKTWPRGCAVPTTALVIDYFPEMKYLQGQGIPRKQKIDFSKLT